jgi:hypothetical protein
MSWLEQELKDRKQLPVSQERAKTLDTTKMEVHPIIVKEAAQGDKGFDAIRFQPVKSPGIFEAEFAKKDSDLIFHFWPWGLHEADRTGSPRPPFSPRFRYELQSIMESVFDKRFVKIDEDRDMGSMFVKVTAAGAKQFWHDLGVKAVTKLHHALGGE